jgi:hypothetical protein
MTTDLPTCIRTGLPIRPELWPPQPEYRGAHRPFVGPMVSARLAWLLDSDQFTATYGWGFEWKDQSLVVKAS